MARDRRQVVGGPEGVLGRCNRWIGAVLSREPQRHEQMAGTRRLPLPSVLGCHRADDGSGATQRKTVKASRVLVQRGKAQEVFPRHWFRGTGSAFSVDVAPRRGYSPMLDQTDSVLTECFTGASYFSRSERRLAPDSGGRPLSVLPGARGIRGRWQEVAGW